MPRETRKTSLGNILEAAEESSNARVAELAPAVAPLPPTAATAIAASTHPRRHSFAGHPIETSSSPPSGSPVLFRSVREALESDSKVAEDPGGYTVTRRSPSMRSQIAEADGAGYTVIRRASCDGVSEVRGTVASSPTTGAATRRRQSKRSQQEQHRHSTVGHVQQQQSRHGKKESRHHHNESAQPHQQPWRRDVAALETAPVATTTRARMEQLALQPNDLDDEKSSWIRASEAAAMVPSAAVGTSATSSCLWLPDSGATGSNQEPEEVDAAAANKSAATEKEEDPHVAWRNASMWAASSSSSSQPAPTPPAPTTANMDASPSSIPTETMMSSWLGWDSLANASERDGL